MATSCRKGSRMIYLAAEAKIRISLLVFAKLITFWWDDFYLFFLNLDESAFLWLPFCSSIFSLFLCMYSTVFGSKVLVRRLFFPSFWDSKVNWKQSSSLGSFPGVPLSWNESRSLCSLFVSICYVFGIPLRPHLPSHIQITPWSSFWLLLPPLAVASSLCRWLWTATMYCFSFEHHVKSFHMWPVCPRWGLRTHRSHALLLCEMKPLVLLSLPPNSRV